MHDGQFIEQEAAMAVCLDFPSGLQAHRSAIDLQLPRGAILHRRFLRLSCSIEASR